MAVDGRLQITANQGGGGQDALIALIRYQAARERIFELRLEFAEGNQRAGVVGGGGEGGDIEHLAASGLNGQSFAFVGYVPSTPAERIQRIKELESLALRTGQTRLMIETPYRNGALLQALLQTLQPGTRLATASGLTLANAACLSDLVKHWKQRGWSADNAQPTVFAIGK